MTADTGLGRAIRRYADTIYGVPGYPVTDLIEETGAELVINEKTALEYALGDSLSGRRACVIVKHVGMNALLDPLVHATAQGLKAGVVVVVGDDPAAKGTQTVQDSRLIGAVAGIPVLGMDNSCPVSEAFSASEQYSRVALIRFCPEDLATEWDEGEEMQGRKTGSLADPDLTMFGRAVRAHTAVASMTDAGYVAFPIPPITGDHPESRSERGYSRVICPECPFKPVFAILEDQKMQVIPDTGCSLISLFPPYLAGVANYGMGSSVAVAARSFGVALTGDYALLHSGIQGLIDLHAKGRPLLCIVLYNRCMGATGGQSIPDLLEYIGFAKPVICAADDHETLKRMIQPGTGLRVVVVKGECPEERCI